jgi:acetolactate synthase-1/2/3 large subunit
MKSNNIIVKELVINFLVEQGISEVFLVTGGHLAFIVDSFHDRHDIRYICTQHEQAAAMAADAYARMTGKFGVAMTTSGPGSTNLITGIGCSWFDSIPVLLISGSVNTFETKGNLAVRQKGFQETDIVAIVKPITKYSKKVDDPTQILYELEKAVSIATGGRPGPVLLDLPIDVQRAEVNQESLTHYENNSISLELDSNSELIAKAKDTISLLAKAKRPVFIAGAGIRIANAKNEFLKFIETWGIPTVPSWASLDLMVHNHPLYVEQFGVYGNRAANYTVQNADLIISVGSRLDNRMTGAKVETFARGAKKIIVDIDKSELHKAVKADIPVLADAKDFLHILNSVEQSFNNTDFSPWQKKITDWKAKYPIITPDYNKAKYVNPYIFVEQLCKSLPDDIVTVIDAGSNLTWAMQVFEIKGTRKIFSAYGYSPMGYAFPASIGASIAMKEQPVVCLIGDGGLQMNIQELQTMFHYKLPVKLFILNNCSYGSLTQFQDELFGSRYEASIPDKGYSFPDFVKVAEAYGLLTEKIANHDEINNKVDFVLNSPGPVVCNVMIDEDSRVLPKTIFGNPIEDQAPLLDRREFSENMIVAPIRKD